MLENDLSDASRRKLLWLYIIWATVIVLLGTWSIAHIIAQIGSTYGGVIWVHDPTLNSSFYVGPELWRSIPQSEKQLQFMDVLVSINGREPEAFGDVYEMGNPGDQITYIVKRKGKLITIHGLLLIYDWEDFIISHGLMYLLGWVYIIAGYSLLRSTRWQAIALISFAFVTVAGGWFFHGVIAGIHGPYVGPFYEAALLWYPAMPISSAILLDFALIFPTPIFHNRRFLSFLRYGIYGFAVMMIALYCLTSHPSERDANLKILNILSLTICAAIFAIVLHSLVVLIKKRRQRSRPEYQIARTMMAVWALATAGFVLLGILPVVIFKRSLFPAEALLALALLFPLALVYAINNSEMISRLHHEIILRKTYGEQIRDLTDIREQTLHEVADNLHDRIIPQLRGLYLAAIAMRRQTLQMSPEAFTEEIAFIADTLDAVSTEARSIMEGVKPVDWEQTSLQQALAWLADRFRYRNPDIQVILDVNRYDENDVFPVKDTFYRIARLALNNTKEHARAQIIHIHLSSDNDESVMRIEDDGVGFDTAHAFSGQRDGRRHLGLKNARLYAAQIGARLIIESQPGQGVRLTVIKSRRSET